ncbi:MAG: hypothetical protein R2746_17495 [Acidimicrobiales bacterium]
MPHAPANGVHLAYETFGDPADPTILLIMGLGAQMVSWDDEICHLFVDRGYHVIRFDNRDVGESTWLDTPTSTCPPPSWPRWAATRRTPPTRWATWPTTPWPCSTTSASTPPTWWARPWAG